MKPGRICFLIEDYYPVLHGASTQLAAVTRRLHDRGVEVLIITRKVYRDNPIHHVLNGADVWHLGPAVGLSCWGKYVMIPHAFITLLRLRRRYDLIVVCDIKVLGVLAVLIGRLTGKPCWLKPESCGEMDGGYITQFGTQPGRVMMAVVRQGIRLRNALLRRAAGFLSISSVITDELVRCGVSRSVIRPLVTGINLDRFAPVDPERKTALRKELGMPDGLLFIFTGRLSAGKGLEYLMPAWERHVKSHPSSHLIVIGSGQNHALSCEDELRNSVTLKQLEHSVTFTGFVENIERYLQAGDVLVLPSQTESLSLSLVEAMACGLACISTGVGGMQDYFKNGQNGIQVPYGDEAGLCAAMNQLAEDDTLRRALGEEAAREVRRKYDIERSIDTYVELLQEVGP